MLKGQKGWPYVDDSHSWIWHHFDIPREKNRGFEEVEDLATLNCIYEIECLIAEQLIGSNVKLSLW